MTALSATRGSQPADRPAVQHAPTEQPPQLWRGIAVLLLGIASLLLAGAVAL